jgi:hypothetical protein
MVNKRYAVTITGTEGAPLGFSNVWIDAPCEGVAKSIMLDTVSNDLCCPRETLMASARLVKKL